MPSLLQAWALPGALLAIANIAATWYNLVSEHVPDAYLDEVFHIPQAQRYCKGNYSWDSKITTPPGLYLISLMLDPVIGCSTASLRALSAGAICLIFFTSYVILRNHRSPTSAAAIVKDDQKEVSEKTSHEDQSVILDAHTAFNIALFPPLFFFSALYYTDVPSTLVVLLTYSAFTKRGIGSWGILDEIRTVLMGVMALLFRQTNIFWVAVFPAGLTVIRTFKRKGNLAKASPMSPSDALSRSWNEGRVYDMPVCDAGIQDYILVALSVALAAIRAPFSLLKPLFPYGALLGLFASFVAWNGGVVLGDKSNHVATIHTPQMLYFWPYMIFFSFPLTLPWILAAIVSRLPESNIKSSLQKTFGKPDTTSPGVLPALTFMLLGLASVHFNTIVHPFTRADNRHYVFYVFRILMRHWAIKYAAVPVYYVCGWLVLQTLSTPSKDETQNSKQKRTDARTATTDTDREPVQASFVLVWLATTALSVVSAPLVEPRYLIIPWIMWRLHVPSISGTAPTSPSEGKKSAYDMRLAVETVWHVTINIVTGYLFFYKGFTWPSEPGKVQRFMW